MLPNVEIVNITYLDNGDIIVRVNSTELGVNCKNCGKHITKYHGLNKTIKLKHLSAFGHNVYIEFQPIRFQCLNCDNHPTTTQIPSWYQNIGQCTTPYAKYILESLINSTIQDVARKENISYDQVMSIIKKHVPEEIDWSTIQSIKDIGIDEISLKKGHKDFVVIISSKKDGKPIVLGVLKNRKKDTVKEFLLSIPKHLSSTVENVCCDMYDGFINAAKEVFGSKVNIVIDRFHVAKNYRNAIDTLRKKEMNRLKLELTEEDYKKLKNVMWILRKNYDELTDDEKDTLNFLFKVSPLLKKAYKLQNELTKIFNKPLSKKQASQKIKQWIKRVENSGLTCFNTFIKTLKKLWNEILNYFINRLNSGFVEGLNNKIKILKRRCYGIFDLKNLFRRISIDLASFA
jgi:transposase